MTKSLKTLMIVCLSMMVMPSILFAEHKVGHISKSYLFGYIITGELHSNCEKTVCTSDPATGRKECERVSTPKSRAGKRC